jgi:chorismate mutase
MNPKPAPKKVQKKLLKFRHAIDQADRALLKAFQKRARVSERVGKLKREFNLPIVQPERWKVVVEDRVKQGKRLKINEAFLRNILELIHHESIRIQKRGKK